AAQLHAHVGLLLLVHQVGHIVNGDHVGPDHEKRYPVQRDVNQVGGKPSQIEGKRDVVESGGIAPRVDRGAEVLRQARQGPHVRRAADQRVLVGAVDLAECVYQAANIRTDAEVPYAAGIEYDVKRHGNGAAGP